MRLSLKTGFGFGLTSGVITTLGLIVGLNAGTHSQIAVIGGIITIAIADAFSDALGIHISQESQNKYSERSIWESTISTFLSKFIVALTFIGPILFLELSQAIPISIIWGFSILIIFNYIIAKQQKKNPWEIIGEHITIALAVVIITSFVGGWIENIFK
jgi:VIT1/CCC1 family predicted Fe2+/Mn2+ transporter